jgi:hypothetical protein
MLLIVLARAVIGGASSGWGSPPAPVGARVPGGGVTRCPSIASAMSMRVKTRSPVRVCRPFTAASTVS